MRKRDEINDPTSCLNKAYDGETLFVLLGRDEAAPAAIQYWIDERVRLGLNRPFDKQLKEAATCAANMRIDCETIATARSRPEMDPLDFPLV